MINTKQAKLKRAMLLEEMGIPFTAFPVIEPYVTWEDFIYALENSLQLSEARRICNSRKESK